MQDNQRQAVLNYLSGIIDGEGCIRLGRQPYKKHPDWAPQYYGCISVGMVDRRIIDLLNKTFTPNTKNKIYEERVLGRKPVYRWIVRKEKELLPILEELHPRLIVKKEQVEILMTFFKNRTTIGFQRNQGITAKELRWREGLFQKMKLLNLPGAAATK